MRLSLKVSRSPDFSKISKSLKRKSKRTREDIGEDIIDYIFRQLIKNVTRRDYTLNQLRALNYPFSKKENSSKTGLAPYMVHTRSGSFASTFSMNRKGTNQFQAQFNIEFNPTKDYHHYIVKGTKVMRARDPVQGTLRQPNVQKKIQQAIRNKMKMNFG